MEAACREVHQETGIEADVGWELGSDPPSQPPPSPTSWPRPKAFAQVCAQFGVTQSMGAVGTCADNALAESFNATLKRETLRGEPCWPDASTCRREVFRWVTRYNTRRRHSWCGQQAPNVYEQQHAATLRLAA